MSRITQALRRANESGLAGFIPFLTAGFPNIEKTHELVCELSESGATVVELGIPFSDPLADGPTIQKSSDWAIKQGTKVTDVFQAVRRAREKSEVPIVLMTYVNPILNYGPRRFSSDAKKAGADGVIVSDLPPEEERIWEEIESSGLDTIHLISPTTGEERMTHILSRTTGFVYCLSRFGVTGRGKRFYSGLEEKIETIRKHTRLPVAVGFGVRDEKDVKEISRFADAVIVGAALVEALETGFLEGKGSLRMVEFAKRISQALYRGEKG